MNGQVPEDAAVEHCERIRWTVKAEIAVPAVSAQLHHYYWPTDEPVAIERDCYYFVQYLSSDLSVASDERSGFAPATPGCLGLLPPRQRLHFRMREGWHESFVCMFDPKKFEEVTGIDRRWGDDDLQRWTDIRVASLRQGMLRIRNELAAPGFASKLAVESAATLVTIDFARYLRDASERHAIGLARGGLSSRQLRLLNDRIAEMAVQGVPSLTELSKLCGCSAAHLMRNFKKTTGKTLQKAIEARRIDLATDLLKDRSLSVQEVAFRLDFTSPAYFATAFKRSTTYSPSEFRRTVGIA